MNRPLILIVAALAAAVAGVAAWYTWHQASQSALPVAAVPALPALAESPAPPAIQHPVEDAALAGELATTEAVPLDHSDSAMREALAALFAGHVLPPFLRVDRIIRNVVATVDALPRENVSPTVMPMNPAPGRMVVSSDGGATTIASDNAPRYVPYINVLRAVDARLAASIYLKHYALFQQAYRELGYPNGYFNDRLVSVIDLLLATPEVQGPIKLDQPKVVYVYADPALEALSAGQKILLRIGNDNAAIVKAKLREFRGHIVRTPPPR